MVGLIGFAAGALALAPHAGDGAGLIGDTAGDVALFTARLLRVGLKLRGHANELDDRAASEILDLMRSRAPHRTGKLRGGIEGHTEGEGEARAMVITAKAQSARGSGLGADYAPFMEYGTKPHGATEAYFEGNRTRPARGGHPGTEAQPFFWNSASEVLGRRQEALDAGIDQISAEEGFDP